VGFSTEEHRAGAVHGRHCFLVELIVGDHPAEVAVGGGEVPVRAHPVPHDDASHGFPPWTVQPCNFMTGRTSTEPPPNVMGQPFASSVASARSAASIIMKPSTMSFASANGPSVT